MLTEETTDAVLVIESINQEQSDRANYAMSELKQLIDTYFKTESVMKVLTVNDSSFEF